MNPDHNFIYAPTYCTRENIENLRRSKGVLDFEGNILPLLQQELQAAYARKTDGKVLDIDLFFNPEKRINRRTRETFRESFLSYLRWDTEQCALGKMDSAYKFCQDAICDLRDQLRAAIDFRGLSDESYEQFYHLLAAQAPESLRRTSPHPAHADRGWNLLHRFCPWSKSVMGGLPWCAITKMSAGKPCSISS